MAETACWQGALLWPEELPTAETIDCRGVSAMGLWLHAWLRARPGLALAGLPTALQRQLQEAAVPVLFYSARVCAGVSPDERAALWS